MRKVDIVLIIIIVFLFVSAYTSHSAEFVIMGFNSAEEVEGDVVEVRPNGSAYGTQERNPAKFRIIRVLGLQYKANRLFMSPDWSGAGKDKIMINRRGYTIGSLSNLDPYYSGDENFYDMTVGQWNALIEKK
jgi:hypothetical protein